MSTSSQIVATFSAPSTLLRKALLCDAAFSGLAGIVLLSAADPLARLLDLPAELLRWSGAILIPCAALVALIGSSQHVRRPLVVAIIACNLFWAMDSVLLLFTDWVSPNVAGRIFIMAQSITVAALAEFEFMGLRRS